MVASPPGTLTRCRRGVLRASLIKPGVWAQVSGRLAAAESACAALEEVARGEAQLGMVYRADALAQPRVRGAQNLPR